MNLTYEIKGKGYTILNDGKTWIVQEDYIPYPGDYTEESAQNHIDVILNQKDIPVEPSEVDVLRVALAELAESLELEKLNTQLALAELAESMIGGVK